MSRHALPHGARLRSRSDMGPIGAIAMLGVVIALVAADAAFAAPSKGGPALAVEETAELDVVLTVSGVASPTFQVFQVPGHNSYVIELPGLPLENIGIETRGPGMHDGAGVLLDAARVEPAQKKGPGRVVLAFADDVDYDASTNGGALSIRFRHAGDKKSLLASHAKRRADAEKKVALAGGRPTPSASAATVSVDDKKKAEEAAAALKKQQAEEEAARIALEAKKKEDEKKAAAAKKKADDEAARVAAIDTNKRADEEKKALEAKKKAEEEKKARVAALDAKKKAEEEKKALETKKKADEEAARVAALDAKKKAEEEKRAEAAQKKADEEAARVAAIDAKKKADEDKKALDAKKKADDEAARVAAIDAKKKAEEEKRAFEAKKKADDEAARVAAIEAEKKKNADDIEAKKKADDDARVAAIEAEKKRIEAQKRAEEQKRLVELKRVEEQKRMDAQKRADEEKRIETQKRADEEKRRADALRVEEERKRADAERKRRDEERLAAIAREQAKPARSETRTPGANVSTGMGAAPRDNGPSGEWGFGGQSVDLGRPARYERYTPPAREEDDFGGEEEEGTDLDERSGRGVLTAVTVQRLEGGSRVGVRVDGGARYNIAKRASMMAGRSELVLTLFDTRAKNLDVRRILDARSLDTTVLRVLPTVEEDARYRVELVVELKRQAPVRVIQEGGTLWLVVGDE